MAAGKKGKNIYVVLNGKKSGDTDLREAIGNLREEGHNVLVRVTYEDGDSERYVKEALKRKDVDVIVAAGGDGSVNEIAGAIVKENAPSSTAMAVIPMGTANDFATAAGIPTDPWEALQLAVHDTAYPVDVGIVNDQVFMNIATGGFGTEITAQTDEGLKNKLGGAAYLLTGISNPQAVAARRATGRVPLTALTKKNGEYQKIEVGPDSFAEVKEHSRKNEKVAEFSGDLLVLAVGISRQAGGGHQLCPDAVIDDGLLDVSYALNVSPDQIPVILDHLFDSDKSVAEISELFGNLRCKWLEVDCPDELQVNRDGEPMRSDKYRFEILPQRLRLHLPNQNLLQQGQGQGSDRNGAGQPSSPRTQQQNRFMKKVNFTPDRPRAEKGKVKAKAIASTAAQYGLAFGAGGIAGAFAQRRGWFNHLRFR